MLNLYSFDSNVKLIRIRIASIPNKNEKKVAIIDTKQNFITKLTTE